LKLGKSVSDQPTKMYFWFAPLVQAASQQYPADGSVVCSAPGQSVIASLLMVQERRHKLR
jgi:hypothetical protein